MATSTIELSPMQLEAIDSIVQWFKHEKKQTFFLAGYAGTGKTTLVEHAIKELGIRYGKIAFACYTGKAALVLTRKLKKPLRASTIHRLIYQIDINAKGKTEFIKKKKSELSHLKLLIIDEWSMVDAKILEDLLSFGIKVLLIGDQGQLPPVSKEKSELLQSLIDHPDFELTEIHRQAKDNPIIYLSMLARTKQPIKYGTYGKNGEAIVISKTQWKAVKKQCYTTADQIICGYNRTRHSLNEDIRKYIGFKHTLPEKGDKLICTRNNWDESIEDINLVNGLTGYVEDIKYDISEKYEDVERDAFEISFRPDFTESKFTELRLINDHFEGKEYRLSPFEYNIYSSFDYGYAITCHKSQGSQWEKVVVISEKLNAEEHHRWLYTAITRSSDRLVLVI